MIEPIWFHLTAPRLLSWRMKCPLTSLPSQLCLVRLSNCFRLLSVKWLNRCCSCCCATHYTSTIIRTIIPGDGSKDYAWRSTTSITWQMDIEQLDRGKGRGRKEARKKSQSPLPENSQQTSCLFLWPPEQFKFKGTVITVGRFVRISLAAEWKWGWVDGWLVHNNQMWVSIPLTDKNWKSTRPALLVTVIQRHRIQWTLPQCLLAGPHLHGNGIGIMFHYLFLITFCGFFCSLAACRWKWIPIGHLQVTQFKVCVVPLHW